MSDGGKPVLYNKTICRSGRSGPEGTDMSDGGKLALYKWTVSRSGRSGHGRHT